MSINLTKSSSISLEKISPSLQNVHVGLGWDAEIVCDLSLFMIDENAFIRILNKENNEELCRYNLSNEFNDVDSVQIARLYKYDNQWHFEALADGYSGGLGALLGIYN
jgi:stress response protein SCP2